MIAYDLQAVQSRSHGERGIARYCLETAFAIERMAPGRVDRWVVNPHRPIPESIEPLIRSGRVCSSVDLRHERIDLLHITSPVELDVPLGDLVVGSPRRLVMNAYDLIPLVFAEHYLVDPSISSRYRARVSGYLAADLILTDSQSAADDLHRLIGVPKERCLVAGAGASTMFTLPPQGRQAAVADAVSRVPGLRPGFVMLPSGIDWRKNIDGVLEAYASLDSSIRRDHQLVLVCRATDDERELLGRRATELGCASSFLITGFVPDDLLVSLYQAAELVVFPSRYEGFGLPVLEARRCGAPVVCGDNSSLREVQPDDGARFDVDSVEAIRSVVERALTDASFTERLRSAEIPDFTWDRVARLTLEAYDTVLRRPRSGELLGDHRPRIAYVSPLPPVASGVATYTSRLMTALGRIARVRVFTDQPLHDVPWPPGVMLSPLAELHQRVADGEFDHVVYALGNNDTHHGGLYELRRTPGVIHLHDVRLVNCYADQRWPAVVEFMYPGRYGTLDLASFQGPWSESLRSKTVLLVAEAARLSDGILVHSQHAATLVHLDTGREAIDIGPLASPAVDEAADAPTSIDRSGPVLASFGIVSPAKQSDKVLRAFEAVVRSPLGRRLGVRAVLVGETPPGLASEDVLLTGAVSDAEFAGWMSATAVAVQLRAWSNGESSAAVAECLAAGVPTVVTDLGSASELPDDAVVKLPRDASADDLAALLEELLTDEARRTALAERSRRFASENSFDAAAERLLAALVEISRRATTTAAR